MLGAMFPVQFTGMFVAAMFVRVARLAHANMAANMAVRKLNIGQISDVFPVVLLPCSRSCSWQASSLPCSLFRLRQGFLQLVCHVPCLIGPPNADEHCDACCDARITSSTNDVAVRATWQRYEATNSIIIHGFSGSYYP